MTRRIVADLEALLGNEALPNDDLGDREYFLRVGRIEAFEECIATVQKVPPCACGGREPYFLNWMKPDVYVFNNRIVPTEAGFGIALPTEKANAPD